MNTNLDRKNDSLIRGIQNEHFDHQIEELFNQHFDQFEDEIREVDKSKKKVFSIIIKYRPNYVWKIDINLLIICMIISLSTYLISDSITKIISLFIYNKSHTFFCNTIIIYGCICLLFHGKIDIEKID
ncbi:MAG: hypothetical protein WD512_13055 [Candidatus Paceibacterota bacterium]